MDIFYTVDNNFIPQLAAGICSVCENNRHMDSIRFFVGSLAISDQNQQALAHLAAQYGRSVRFIEIGDLRRSIGFDFDTQGWNDIIIARLLIDQLLPPDVERVLYLDSDTIVRAALDGLWNTDLEGRTLGACVEATMNRKRREAIGLRDTPYYNSGVLLIDLKLWRERRAGERVLDFYRSRGGSFFAPDQDAINGALAGEILTLSPKYNFYTMCWYYPYRVLVRLSKPAPYVPEAVFQDALAHPAIIHYLGEVRPWRRGNGHKYAADYQHYLSLTPWRDAPAETGWETYFFCYKLFLSVLKPFPMLRYHLIDTLFPLLMKYRENQRKKSK